MRSVSTSKLCRTLSLNVLTYFQTIHFVSSLFWFVSTICTSNYSCIISAANLCIASKKKLAFGIDSNNLIFILHSVIYYLQLIWNYLMIAPYLHKKIYFIILMKYEEKLYLWMNEATANVDFKCVHFIHFDKLEFLLQHRPKKCCSSWQWRPWNIEKGN